MGHPDVHQDDVGPLFPGQRDRLGAVARLADDLEVRRGVDEHPEAAAHERWVRIGPTMSTASSQVRTVVEPCPVCRCLVLTNCAAISANKMNAAVRSPGERGNRLAGRRRRGPESSQWDTAHNSLYP
jgi:hypothetical protein